MSMTETQAAYLDRKFAALESRVAALEAGEAHLPEECRAHECSYYRHYMVHFDPDRNGHLMPHESFHEAERRCEAVQQRVTDWADKNPTGNIPDGLMKLADYWEKKVCA
jgi:hypothetical protein